MKRCVACVLLIVAAPGAACAGAWTLPQGTGQWLAGLSASTATSYFNGSGLSSAPRYNKEELQALIEYGVTDQLTAIVNPGLQHIDIAANRIDRAVRPGIAMPADDACCSVGHSALGSLPAITIALACAWMAAWIEGICAAAVSWVVATLKVLAR